MSPFCHKLCFAWQPSPLERVWWNLSSLQDDLQVSRHKGESCSSFYKPCALLWAREGRYSNALQVLSSQGVLVMMMTLFTRICLLATPLHHVQIWIASLLYLHWLLMNLRFCLACGLFLRAASKLCAQHLLDAIAGSTAPAASDCLLSLTRLMNHLLQKTLLLVLLPGFAVDEVIQCLAIT